MQTQLRSTVKTADEIWIVCAILHRENPGRQDFAVKEIAERARREGISGPYRHALYVHAFQHCVANLEPDRGRYRMLFATGKLTRRLFRPGDSYHPAREGGKITPVPEEIPSQFRFLLDWYQEEYAPKDRHPAEQDSILALRGVGKEMWADEDPDEYVRRLREGWE
jgi:hypothetical protein